MAPMTTGLSEPGFPLNLALNSELFSQKTSEQEPEKEPEEEEEYLVKWIHHSNHLPKFFNELREVSTILCTVAGLILE